MLKSKHLIPVGLAHIFLLLLISSGCRSKAPAAVQTATPEVPHWNWEIFPAVQRMRLATLPCQLL
ncbi:MAG TPA: hypothetical protein VLT16_12465, partial [Candidatus Limnocylindrales bacterium]|nr:hypothetical protein [Candidatus Limnocylindrales bacterium]